MPTHITATPFDPLAARPGTALWLWVYPCEGSEGWHLAQVRETFDDGVREALPVWALDSGNAPTPAALFRGCPAIPLAAPCADQRHIRLGGHVPAHEGRGA
jgi:hypothetical protein